MTMSSDNVVYRIKYTTIFVPKSHAPYENIWIIYLHRTVLFVCCLIYKVRARIRHIRTGHGHGHGSFNHLCVFVYAYTIQIVDGILNRSPKFLWNYKSVSKFMCIVQRQPVNRRERKTKRNGLNYFVHIKDTLLFFFLYLVVDFQSFNVFVSKHFFFIFLFVHFVVIFEMVLLCTRHACVCTYVCMIHTKIIVKCEHCGEWTVYKPGLNLKLLFLYTPQWMMPFNPGFSSKSLLDFHPFEIIVCVWVNRHLRRCLFVILIRDKFTSNVVRSYMLIRHFVFYAATAAPAAVDFFYCFASFECYSVTT